MRKRIIIGLVAILVIALVASTSVLALANGKDTAKEPEVKLSLAQAIALDFQAAHGTGAKLLQDPKPVDKIYLIYWQDATKVYASLWIDGLEAVIASQPLSTPTPAPDGG